MIHKTAIVDSKAKVSSSVKIGAYSVIGPNVEIGDNTIIHSQVNISGNTKIGIGNKIYPFAAIGNDPQDLKFDGEETKLVIGDNNKIREYVTIHPGTGGGGGLTKIGNKCLFMISSHVAHDCSVGNNVVISNSVQVAGHVLIEDRAGIGGLVGIHQFVHIGSLSMIGGMTKVERDVPPYCLVEGNPGRMRSLNIVGIKRSGLESKNKEEFQQLQETWKLIYRSGHILKRGLELAGEKHLSPSSACLCSFLEASLEKERRGPIRVDVVSR